MPRLERRYKCIHISEQQVLNCFGMPQQEYISRIFFPDLPEDVQTVTAHYNHMRQCWEVILYHESFPLVLDYEFPPEIHANCEIRQVPVRLPMWEAHYKEQEKLTTLEFKEPITVRNGETVGIKEDLNGKFLVEHRDCEGNLLTSQECENKIARAEAIKRATDTIRYEKSQLQSWRDKPSQF